ncbi:DUF1285 domain-containing protein [Ferrimonas pelagia]|uniref:DUF1285 domain-containing protein n=1 Tax=Ferrimonas pelagia TaxID=1177826 RepID=A0ABP9EX40_9GAMM
MLARLETQVGEHPKLDNWDPPLCGDIDIQIDRQGQWHSLGTPMHRERLVRLFASVLRREADGDYYLVTPVEKWRIKVADKPFVMTELVQRDGQWWLQGPFDLACPISGAHPWTLEQGLPCVRLWHGNQARISRNLYYQLAEQAIEKNGQYGIELAEQWCVLGDAEPA